VEDLGCTRDPSAPDKIKDVAPAQDVDMEGQGEILRIEARPANGQRTITLDSSTGLIIDQTFESLPERIVWHAMGRLRSKWRSHLTTVPIRVDSEDLDVLKREKAPATFFLIGIQADKYADLTERIYARATKSEPHFYASDISKHFEKPDAPGTQPYRASICQPFGNSLYSVSPAVCH